MNQPKDSGFLFKDCQFRNNLLDKKSITEPERRRLGDDPCNVQLTTVQSAGPGIYKLNDISTYDNCWMEHPGYIARNSGTLSGGIDIESELRSLNYPLSYCPGVRYSPIKNCIQCEKCNTGIPCECAHCKKRLDYNKAGCGDQLIPEFTRFNKRPCHTIASSYVDRFENLCVDVQDVERIHSNNYIGDNTRLLSRDATTNMTKELVNSKNLNKPPDPECCNRQIGISPSSLNCEYLKDVPTYKIMPYF
jgi:hypothetical protein